MRKVSSTLSCRDGGPHRPRWLGRDVTAQGHAVRASAREGGTRPWPGPTVRVARPARREASRAATRGRRHRGTSDARLSRPPPRSPRGARPSEMSGAAGAARIGSWAHPRTAASHERPTAVAASQPGNPDSGGWCPWRVVARDRSIARPRVHDLVADATVVLLEAPGGYGKTTTARQLAATLDLPLVRAVLPETAGLAELLSALAQAARRAGVPALADALDVEDGPGSLARLLARLEGFGGVVLTVDEAQRATTDASAWLARLAGAVPAGARLVLAGRRLQPSLRALVDEVEAVLLDADALRMDADEVARLLADTGAVDLAGASDLAGSVLRSTEGWPAAVALAASTGEATRPGAWTATRPIRRRGACCVASWRTCWPLRVRPTGASSSGSGRCRCCPGRWSLPSGVRERWNGCWTLGCPSDSAPTGGVSCPTRSGSCCPSRSWSSRWPGRWHDSTRPVTPSRRRPGCCD